MKTIFNISRGGKICRLFLVFITIWSLHLIDSDFKMIFFCLLISENPRSVVCTFGNPSASMESKHNMASFSVLNSHCNWCSPTTAELQRAAGKKTQVNNGINKRLRTTEMNMTISVFGFGANRQNCYWVTQSPTWKYPVPEFFLLVFKAMLQVVQLLSLGSDLCGEEQWEVWPHGFSQTPPFAGAARELRSMSWHLPELCCRYVCAQPTFVHPQPPTLPPRWPCPVLIQVNVLWICLGMRLLTLIATFPPYSPSPSAPCPLPTWAPSSSALAGQLLLSQKINLRARIFTIGFSTKAVFCVSWTEKHSLI